MGEKIGNKNLNGIMGLASTHISYHKRFGHKRILKDAEKPVIKEDLEKTNPIYPTWWWTLHSNCKHWNATDIGSTYR